MARNITTGITTLLAEGLVAPTAPRINGKFVVWGARNETCSSDGTFSPPTGEWSIIVFDLDTMEPIKTIGPLTSEVWNPAIDGDRIIWGQSSALAGGLTEEELMYLDLESGEPPGKLGVALQNSYDISGNGVVYVGRTAQLVFIDLTDMRTTIIDEGRFDSPTIDDSHIAWDARTGDGAFELRALALDSGQRFTLDSGPAPHQPHLEAGTLVWQSGSARSGYGIRSASVDDFERLQDVETRNVAIEILLWSVATLGAVAIAGITWRRIRGARQTYRSTAK